MEHEVFVLTQIVDIWIKPAQVRPGGHAFESFFNPKLWILDEKNQKFNLYLVQ